MFTYKPHNFRQYLKVSRRGSNITFQTFSSFLINFSCFLESATRLVKATHLRQVLTPPEDTSNNDVRWKEALFVLGSSKQRVKSPVLWGVFLYITVNVKLLLTEKVKT